MAWKIAKRKYDRATTVGKLSVPGLIVSVAVASLTSGAVSLAGSLGGLLSLFGLAFGAFGWLLGTVFGTERTRRFDASSQPGARSTRGDVQPTRGGDVGYLEYQCERCGTVLNDWNINEFGSEYTCGECGYALDDQRAAREKVDEGWAWDEEEGLA
ncbi:DC1 domain-containing protein [Salinigranum marinum]|uniref:DC1 domain-containing protein n=1 Tax=Salinigranum marinum TaxID=1515595 RepID=UPI002989A725|nr:DC1 domain-containing protein [Salinigranum marinum]